jgi:hypothetical protein
MIKTAMQIPVEEKARFEVWDNDHSMVLFDVDIFSVREYIEEALEETDLDFGISLQEGFLQDNNSFLVYMHSENEEGYLTGNQLTECNKHGFSNSNYIEATQSILDYIGLKVIFSHFI